MSEWSNQMLRAFEHTPTSVIAQRRLTLERRGGFTHARLLPPVHEGGQGLSHMIGDLSVQHGRADHYHFHAAVRGGGVVLLSRRARRGCRPRRGPACSRSSRRRRALTTGSPLERRALTTGSALEERERAGYALPQHSRHGCRSHGLRGRAVREQGFVALTHGQLLLSRCVEFVPGPPGPNYLGVAREGRIFFWVAFFRFLLFWNGVSFSKLPPHVGVLPEGRKW